jgi:hypothetical protein
LERRDSGTVGCDGADGLGADNLNGTDVDDNFDGSIRHNVAIGGQRPSARPAPVNFLAAPSAENKETPRFHTLIAHSKAPEDIDDAFTDSLLPQLLEL